MSAALPGDLRAALARRLEGVSRARLAEAASALSRGYRSGGGSLRHAAGDLAVAAYLAARLPATYAAAGAALDRLIEARPDFAPRSLLDLGAGPGSATFAAFERFPGLEAATLLDHHPAFLAAARGLAGESRHAALRGAHIVEGRLEDAAALPAADLVLMGYALVELPEAALAGLVERAFGAATGALVLVEPGTPEGFRRLRLARTRLIGAGADVAAPCTHALGCPMTGADWCHFEARLPRLRDHMLAKAAEVPFEDEPFAYLAVTRAPGPPPAQARIVAPARSARPGISFRLCSAEGLGDRLVPARDREAFRAARRLDWGDAL